MTRTSWAAAATLLVAMGAAASAAQEQSAVPGGDIEVVAESPNHGSDTVPCGQFKAIYDDQQLARAVTVDLSGSEECPARLVKNASVRRGGILVGGSSCGNPTTGRITRTCRNVGNLFLVCEGANSPDACTARITQVVVDGLGSQANVGARQATLTLAAAALPNRQTARPCCGGD